MAGGVAPVAEAGAGAFNAARSLPWRGFLADQRGAIFLNNVRNPILQPGTPGQMVREAAEILRVTPPDDRLRMGEHLLDQIAQSVSAKGLGTTWTYRTVYLGHGTTVFAGRIGGGLVVTPTSVRILSATEAADVLVTVPSPPYGAPEIIGVLDE
jgi:hypothetical protein